MAHVKGVRCAVFSSDGRYVYAGDEAGSVLVWNVKEGKRERSIMGAKNKAIHAVSLSANGKFVAAVDARQSLLVWSRKDGKELAPLGENKTASRSTARSQPAFLSFALLPDSKRVLTGSDSVTGKASTLRLLDLETGREVRSFVGQREPVRSVALSDDGRRALSGSADGAVRLWDLNGSRDRQKFDGHKAEVCSVAFSPDSRQALSGGRDKQLLLWDVETGKELGRVEHPNVVNSVAFSADGKYAASACADGKVRVWRLAQE